MEKETSAFFDILKRWYEQDQERPQISFADVTREFMQLDEELRAHGTREWSILTQLVTMLPTPQRDLIWNQIINILLCLGFDEGYYSQPEPFPDIVTSEWERDIKATPEMIATVEGVLRAMRAEVVGRAATDRDHKDDARTADPNAKLRRRLSGWRIAAIAWLALFLAVSVPRLFETNDGSLPKVANPKVQVLLESEPETFWLLTLQSVNEPASIDANFRELMSGFNISDTGLVIYNGRK